MELNFFDADDVPQPKDKVRIESLTAEPYPDGWRVKLGIKVTPFQDRPSLEIQVTSYDGRPVARLSVIETMHKSMEFTVHIRGVSNPAGHYRASADLYFEEPARIVDHAETPFSIDS